jgi:hypothetical protein
MKFVSGNESYLHKHAKDVLNRWLEECNGCITCQLDKEKLRLIWRPNWCEINNEESIDDFIYDLVYWHNKHDNQSENLCGELSSYESATLQGHKVVAVIDVVVIHKGMPNYLFEVCHTNPVSKDKLDKIMDCIARTPSSSIKYLIEIDASWIMKQVSRPSVLMVKNIYKL